MLKVRLIISSLILFLTLPSFALQEDPYAISLGSATFTPSAGQDEARTGHFIIQFYEIPSRECMDALGDMGIEVQRYVGGNAYIVLASLNLEALSALPHRGNIRATVPITAAMRLHPDFSDSPRQRKAIRGDDIIWADIRFHPDVSFGRASELLRTAGIGCPLDRFLAANRLVVEAPWSSIKGLLAADEVDTIEPALMKYKLLNLSATKRMNVDQVLRKPMFRKPDGTNVLVGITDAWIVDQTHVEFGNRVTVLHDVNYIETPTEWSALNHATSVAGNIAAEGTRNPKCRGSAPAASILSMVIPFDPVNEIRYAAQNLGLRISSNSWGYDPEEEFIPPVRIQSQTGVEGASLNTRFGYYPNFNYAMDQMVRQADVLYFWAAGNERTSIVLLPLPDEMGNVRYPDDWHRSYPGFDSMLVNPSAKNVLAIGATHKDDVICAFSSCGPGYGGRLGPHLVAPGFDMFTIASDNTYAFGSGTSGSCPMAAGVAALVIDQYRKIHSTEPGSALIKAILFNSARDLGLEGPDYTYGYGMADAQLAAYTLSGEEGVEELKRVRSRFIEAGIRHKQEQFYTFDVPRNKKELRVTLAWNDLPGPKLINNLDLWVRHGSANKVLPLTLDPNDPTAPAVNKRNKRDTAEHIIVKNPQAGEWTIGVKGKKIPKGRQDYALVISAGNGNQAPVRKTNGDFRILRVVPSMGNVNLPIHDFNVGDPIYLHAQIEVLDNAAYDDGYFGTMSVRFELRDEAGVLVYVVSGSMHNMAPCAPGEYRELIWREEEIPEGIQTGTFRVRTTVTMHNGISRVAPEELWITLH
jgi:hypothetical protein